MAWAAAGVLTRSGAGGSRERSRQWSGGGGGSAGGVQPALLPPSRTPAESFDQIRIHTPGGRLGALAQREGRGGERPSVAVRHLPACCSCHGPFV